MGAELVSGRVAIIGVAVLTAMNMIGESTALELFRLLR